ncbi:hypothetical protein GWK47_019873 [Chionoecetes opilio]|uniref:Ig-like domain-containing protein n=1 Tax=Chionoecetes opilio TaxID=41210 RepID=A0A8J4XQJ3_CHIOP|nr:hypothetical protein GWK47_019873 [Chionoecetes opilio]
MVLNARDALGRGHEKSLKNQEAPRFLYPTQRYRRRRPRRRPGQAFVGPLLSPAPRRQEHHDGQGPRWEGQTAYLLWPRGPARDTEFFSFFIFPSSFACPVWTLLAAGAPESRASLSGPGVRAGGSTSPHLHRPPPAAPGLVYWYHNGAMLDYEGSVAILTHEGPEGTRSSLTIGRAAPAHSGNYTC